MLVAALGQLPERAWAKKVEREVARECWIQTLVREEGGPMRTVMVGVVMKLC